MNNIRTHPETMPRRHAARLSRLALAIALPALLAPMPAHADAPRHDKWSPTFPPDFVVADDSPSTPGLFVYPDAYRLPTLPFIGDLETSQVKAADVTWSFLDYGDNYLINGIRTLDDATQAAAPGDRVIAGPGAMTDDPAAADDSRFTITIRNGNLSPLGGPNIDPAQTGVLASETSTVTFLALHEERVSSMTVMIYTEDDGQDRLSPTLRVTPVLTDSFGVPPGWNYATISGIATGSTAGGICIQTPEFGNNVGEWKKPYADIQLVDNGIYIFTLRMTTDQTTPRAIPYWDFSISNAALENGEALGANLYGADFFALDNLDSDYGIGIGRDEFTYVYAPAAFRADSWRNTQTGVFAPAFDPYNDMALSFRVFDAGSDNPGDFDPVGHNRRAGTICMTGFSVSRVDFDNLIEIESIFEQSGFGLNDGATGQPLAGWFHASTSPTQTAASITDGNILLAPANPGASWTNVIDTLAPYGDGLLPPSLFAGLGEPAPHTQAEYEAAFPIEWRDNQLLMMELDLSTTRPDDNTADTIVPIFEAAGVESTQMSLIAPNSRLFNQPQNPPFAGLPATGQGIVTYRAFMYTNGASTALDFDRIRPRVDLYNFPELQYGQNPPLGDVVLERVAVKRFVSPL